MKRPYEIGDFDVLFALIMSKEEWVPQFLYIIPSEELTKRGVLGSPEKKGRQACYFFPNGSERKQRKPKRTNYDQFKIDLSQENSVVLRRVKQLLAKPF